VRDSSKCVPRSPKQNDKLLVEVDPEITLVVHLLDLFTEVRAPVLAIRATTSSKC